MFRVRLESGEIAVFRTVRELSTAVRSGVVGVSAQVFHNESQAWVPIQESQEFQQTQSVVAPVPVRVARKSGGVANMAPQPANVAPAPSAPGPDANAQPHAPEPPPPGASAKPRSLQPLPDLTTAAERQPPGRSGKPLWRVLGFAAPMILAAALAWWPDELLSTGGESAEPTDNQPSLATRRVERAERAKAAEVTEALAEAIAPSRPLPLERGEEADDSLTPTGEPRTSSQGARQPRRQTYISAYAETQETLEEAFELAGVTDLFSPARFLGSDSIRTARRTVAAALNILRSYHDQEVMLDQTYFPGGAGPQSLRESYETAEAGRTLLNLADSLFGLLIAEDGRYRGDRGQIRFGDPAASRRYRDLRERIVELAESTPSIPRVDGGIGATGRLRRVVGDALPPPLAD